MRRGIMVAVVLIVALLLSSCANDEDNTVLVMAAASLANAFSEIEDAFEAEHPGTEVQLNLAGSASLREQILQGAPADVFASANIATMELLVEADLVAVPSIFATNELALAVPIDNPGEITSLADLGKEELLVGLCAEGVPCGDFARQALEQVGVTAAIDTNERDVRSLVTKIAAGELDGGIVYVTDVQQSADLAQVALPSTVDVAIGYPIASIIDPPNPAGAADFVAFVRSSAGQAILDSYGFGAP